jgi:hypothetical protein
VGGKVLDQSVEELLALVEVGDELALVAGAAGECMVQALRHGDRGGLEGVVARDAEAVSRRRRSKRSARRLE